MRDLDKELGQLGASEIDMLLFRSDPERAFSAIDAALTRGADNAVRYAISLFEDPAWRPQKPAKATNLHTVTDCSTCGGDRFVLVRMRTPTRSVWMEEHGIEPNEDAGYEEYAACPDCNLADTSHWSADGTRAAALDPAKVRELIQP